MHHVYFSNGSSRFPHLAGVRVIKPHQKVHISVAFIQNYIPKASRAKNGAAIEWNLILGKGNKENIDWTDGVKDVLDMDLFDCLNAPDIIKNAKGDIKNTYFINQVEFTASFCTFG